MILYFKKKTSNTSHTGITPLGMGMMYTNFDYYLGVPGQDLVTDFRNGNTYSKRFKKIAEEYFSDCPDLLKKIKNKYFKRYKIRAVVKYYNNDCQ